MGKKSSKRFPLLMLKKILAQAIAQPKKKNHAQPKGKKKFHAPENCPTPSPSPPSPPSPPSLQKNNSPSLCLKFYGS